MITLLILCLTMGWDVHIQKMSLRGLIETLVTIGVREISGSAGFGLLGLVAVLGCFGVCLLVKIKALESFFGWLCLLVGGCLNASL